MEDVFRVEYKKLSEDRTREIVELKQKASELYKMISSLGDSRETSLARTKLEESIMWAVKGASN